MFKYFIMQIESQLTQYESSGEQRDEWIADVNFNTDYNDFSTEMAQIYHKKLVNGEQTVGRVGLLYKYERGHYFNFLNETKQYGSFSQTCSILGDVCTKTAMKYIQFYQIIAALPRLMICGQSFESILVNHKALINHLNHNPGLEARLRMHLKETNIHIEGRIPAALNEVSQAELPAPMSECTNLSATWELIDLCEGDDDKDQEDSDEDNKYSMDIDQQLDLEIDNTLSLTQYSPTQPNTDVQPHSQSSAVDQLIEANIRALQFTTLNLIDLA